MVNCSGPDHDFGSNLAKMRSELGRIADRVGARSAVHRGRDRLVELLTGDLVDLLNGNPRSADQRQNRKDDHHLRLLLGFSMRPTSNFLDVGANQGKFLRGLHRLAPDGHHIAYEPIPKLFAKLTERFPEVEIRQAALSDKEGEVPFVHVLRPGFQGYSNLVEGGLEEGWENNLAPYPDQLPTETILVTTERLDNHLPDGWLPDFVKIDVEGAEQLVLRGAMDTLRRAKPVVAFEHAWHDEASEEIYELICDDVGFRMFDMDGHGPLSRAQFIEESTRRFNWVAHE
jgi:FkbM family methyltransferase